MEKQAKYTTVHDARVIKYKNLAGGDPPTVMCAINTQELAAWTPFIDIKRIFYVSEPNIKLRGFHAHRSCQQVLIAVSGEIRVSLYDSVESKSFTLLDPSVGLYMPHGLWVELEYQGPATLLALCDEVYNPEEVIHFKDQFEEWKRS
jgi:dTDP-4-dehydrorhamnose 3,5-epimerase-like enzyme